MQIAQGTNTSVFGYAPDKHRYRQVTSVNSNISETTVYAGGLEIVTDATGTQFRHTMTAYGKPVVLDTFTNDPTRNNIPVETPHYLLPDHLGSVDTVVSLDGTILPQESFDSFGQRRDPTTWMAPADPNAVSAARKVTHRGYTGHEELDNVGLVHMNGRVYDPALGRFLSVDPVFQFPSNGQSLNPYTYVLNNPLSFTDPTGYDCNSPGSLGTCDSSTPETGTHLPGRSTGASCTGNCTNPIIAGLKRLIAQLNEKGQSLGLLTDKSGTRFVAINDGGGNGSVGKNDSAQTSVAGADVHKTSKNPATDPAPEQKPEHVDKYSKTVYGETGNLYPELKLVVNGIDPYTAAYNPANWDSDTALKLKTARVVIANVKERNKITNEAVPDDLKNHIVARAWENAVVSAEMRDVVNLPSNVKFFFIRQLGVGTQGPTPEQWGPVRLYMSFGPFINVGGGDVPKGVNTWIDFYESVPKSKP